MTDTIQLTYDAPTEKAELDDCRAQIAYFYARKLDSFARRLDARPVNIGTWTSYLERAGVAVGRVTMTSEIVGDRMVVRIEAVVLH